MSAAVTIIQLTPEQLQSLIESAIVSAVSILKPASATEDQWFSLEQLVAYDPERRSKATFYTLVSQRQIPFYKSNKKLSFLKSEIDEWLKSGRRRTQKELAAAADKHISKRIR